MAEIREPIKTTSIDKKNRIIDAGLKVFSEKGYYNTNTMEIAKVAGVSTGIVYQYFRDKKDILIYAVKKYYDHIYEPIAKELESINAIDDFDSTMRKMIDAAIKSHKAHSLAHEEMVAMSHLDEDIHDIFIESEHRIIDRILIFLESINIKVPNMHEKVHIGYNLVENLAHEYVFHKHDFIDYDYMISETIRLLKTLFDIK